MIILKLIPIISFTLCHYRRYSSGVDLAILLNLEQFLKLIIIGIVLGCYIVKTVNLLSTII